MKQKDRENLVAGVVELALYMTNTVLAGIVANSGDDNYVQVMHDAEKNMRCALDFLNAFAGSEVMKFSFYLILLLTNPFVCAKIMSWRKSTKYIGAKAREVDYGG